MKDSTLTIFGQAKGREIDVVRPGLTDDVCAIDCEFDRSSSACFAESPLKTAPTFQAPGLPAFGYPAAAATASGTRFGAGVSRTATADTIAASTAKPASA